MYKYTNFTPVNVRNSKAFDVYAGRRNLSYNLPESIFKNPFPVTAQQDRNKVIELHAAYLKQALLSSKVTVEQVLSLRNQRVACWCHPLPCHIANLDKLITELDGKGITTQEQYLEQHNLT